MVKNSFVLIFALVFTHVAAQSDLDKCVDLLERSKIMIIKQDSLINLFKQDVKLCDNEKSAVGKLNQNCELTLKYIEKDLRSERRLKKVWQVIAIAGLSGFVTATILYLTK